MGRMAQLPDANVIVGYLVAFSMSALLWWAGYSSQRVTFRGHHNGTIRIPQLLVALFGNPRGDGRVHFYGALLQSAGLTYLGVAIWSAYTGNRMLLGPASISIVLAVGVAALAIVFALRLLRRL